MSNTNVMSSLFIPDMNADQLDSLARSSNRDSRFAASQIQILRGSSLDFLSRDPDVRIRRNVARHPNTSTQTLHNMRNDPDELVKRFLAANIHSDEITLDKLAWDPSWHVRNFVAGNKSTADYTILLLRNDPHWMVRETVQKRCYSAHVY